MLVTKDDADVLEESLEHALGFCDRVIAMDNCSTDGTWELLRREGGSTPGSLHPNGRWLHGQNRTWLALLGVLALVVGCAVAVAVLDRRDLGAGVLPTRSGPRRASSAWRAAARQVTWAI